MTMAFPEWAFWSLFIMVLYLFLKGTPNEIKELYVWLKAYYASKRRKAITGE